MARAPRKPKAPKASSAGGAAAPKKGKIAKAKAPADEVEVQAAPAVPAGPTPRHIAQATGRRWTPGYKYLADEGRARVEELARDPDQLNPRRLLALQETLVQQAAIPSEELIAERARQIALTRTQKKFGAEIVSELFKTVRSDKTMTLNARELARQVQAELDQLLGEVEVTDLDIEVAERELYMEAAAAIAALQANQRAAAQSVRLDMMFAKYMIPYFNSMGKMTRDLIIEFMPSHELRQIALSALEQRVRTLLAEASANTKTIDATQ